MEKLKIGIVVADKDEYIPLKNVIEKGDFKPYSVLKREGHCFKINGDNAEAEVVSVLCGIGKVNATAATMHLIDMGCNIILNYGLSGGVSEINRGELTVPDKFVEHDFDLSGIGYKLCEKPGQEYIYNADSTLIDEIKEFIPNAKVGTAVSGDSFICDSKVRDRLRDSFGAMSCDMETAAIAYVCSFSNVPFLAIRRISDDAGATAVESYREMNTAYDGLLCDLLLDFAKRLVDKYGK